MRDIDDQDHGAVANPGSFVASHPRPVCRGQGAVNGQPCPTCQGAGVQRFFHGTKADPKPGDLIGAGRSPNFGKLERTTTCVYLTGPILDDPNLKDKRYPGNPTKSDRSQEPLRVTDEVAPRTRPHLMSILLS